MTTALATPEVIQSSATVTHSLPNLQGLSREQRDELFLELIKLRFAEDGLPHPIIVREGDEVVGEFVPVLRPGKMTVIHLTHEERAELQRRLDDPRTVLLTTQEVRDRLERDFGVVRQKS